MYLSPCFNYQPFIAVSLIQSPTPLCSWIILKQSPDILLFIHKYFSIHFQIHQTIITPKKVTFFFNFFKYHPVFKFLYCLISNFNSMFELVSLLV